MFIDFDAKMLFTGQMKGKFNVTMRGFTSKNEKKVQKYMDKLEKHWREHQISARVQQLSTEAMMMERTEIHQKYDVINQDIMRGMLAVEHLVCLMQNGTVVHRFGQGWVCCVVLAVQVV